MHSPVPRRTFAHTVVIIGQILRAPTLCPVGCQREAVDASALSINTGLVRRALVHAARAIDTQGDACAYLAVCLVWGVDPSALINAFLLVLSHVPSKVFLSALIEGQ